MNQTPEDTFHTPYPWTVEADPDSYGTYRLREATIEQRDWVDEPIAPLTDDGPQDQWEAAEQEQERRLSIADDHDRGNTRLMQEAPELYRLLTHVAARLNLEEQENPGGKYILAAWREEINQLLARTKGADTCTRCGCILPDPTFGFGYFDGDKVCLDCAIPS